MAKLPLPAAGGTYKIEDGTLTRVGGTEASGPGPIKPPSKPVSKARKTPAKPATKE